MAHFNSIIVHFDQRDLPLKLATGNIFRLFPFGVLHSGKRDRLLQHSFSSSSSLFHIFFLPPFSLSKYFPHHPVDEVALLLLLLLLLLGLD